MSKHDTHRAQVRAAKLASYRALADLYAAKARLLESELREEADERAREVRHGLRGVSTT